MGLERVGYVVPLSNYLVRVNLGGLESRVLKISNNFIEISGPKMSKLQFLDAYEIS